MTDETDTLNENIKTEKPRLFDFTKIPPPSFGTIVFFEMINSPFIKLPVDVNGVPAVDEFGKPTAAAIPVIPTMLEVVQTIYILLNQNDPEKLTTTISDPNVFKAAVMKMAMNIQLNDVPEIITRINESMRNINDLHSDRKLTIHPLQEATEQ